MVHCRAWQQCALGLVGPFHVQLFLSHSSELPLPTLVLLCFFRLTLSPSPFFLSISSTAPEQPGVSWAFLSSPEQLSFALDVCLQLWNLVTAVRGNIKGKNCLVLPSPVLENPSVPHCWLLWLVLTWELCVTHDLGESEVLFSSTYLHSACTFDSSYSSQAVRSGNVTSQETSNLPSCLIISQRLLNNTWIWKIAVCWVIWRRVPRCPDFLTISGSRGASRGACLNPVYRGKYRFQRWPNAWRQRRVLVFHVIVPGVCICLRTIP